MSVSSMPSVKACFVFLALRDASAEKSPVLALPLAWSDDADLASMTAEAP